jgi:serine/threonine protein kinase/Tol biopolymer transport system component
VPLSPGVRLGPYEVTALLGEGGMGKVWRARHIALKRDDALKVLPDAFALDPGRLARFQREAQVLASLNHPNIAHVYGLEQADGVQALVMELVEGPTLANRIAQGPIPVDEALPIARQIAEALEAAHEQGIVHRDLKPANIKLRPDGVVKVLDFGLAKALEPMPAGVVDATASPTITSPAMMTGVGVLLGTAAYMSPEQARGKPADKRSDIWAFGCVLYEMLTGARAFPGDDLSETLAAVIKSGPDWDALSPETPGSIHRLLRRCLNKERKARLGDAASLRIEIDEAQSEPESTRSVPRSFRKERIVWATGVALLALISALAVAAMVRPVLRDPEVRFDITIPPAALSDPLAISPDGRQIAFVGTTSGQSTVWIHRLDGRTARPLEGTAGAELQVFWSPDSGSVAFFADGMLKRIEIESGAVQTLAEAPRGMGGTWNRDGVILFAPTQGPLFRVSQAGGTVTAVTRVEGPDVRHTSPQFLPDGRHFLFFSTGDANVRGVYVADLEDAAAARLLLIDADAAAVFASPGHLLFPRQGALLAQRFDADRMMLDGEPWQVAESVRTDVTRGIAILSASEARSIVYRPEDFAGVERRLVWFDRLGKEIRRLDDRDPVNTNHMALSPDGRQLAVRHDGSISMLDTERGFLTSFTTERSETAGFFLWSLDGERLVYTENRRGVRNLYQRALTGGESELVLATPGSKTAHDWSPDGRLLLYRDVDPRTGFDLWVLPVEHEGAAADRAGPATAASAGEAPHARGRLQPAPGTKPIPVAQTPFAELNGQFSPDGSWIAYESDESGRFEIYLQPFGRLGAHQRVSIDGGTQPRWRSDGTELFYMAPDGRLMTVPIAASSNDRPIEIGVPVSLFPVRVEAGENNVYQYAVSRDGQQFLVNTVTDVRPAVIRVIVNWAPPR